MRTNEVYSCVFKFFGWTNNIKAVSKVQVVCLFLGNKDKDVLMFFFICNRNGGSYQLGNDVVPPVQALTKFSRTDCKMQPFG